MARLFFAIAIDEAQRQALAEAQDLLRAAGGRAVRWVDPASAHVTLAFLGEVSEQRVAELLEAARVALGPCRVPTLSLGQAGAFPSVQKPATLWLGLEGDVAALVDAQARLAAALEPIGFPGERRPFRPHLTLGRVYEQADAATLAALAEALSQLPSPDPQPWRATAVQLLRSDLLPAGPRYTPLGEAILGHA